MSIRPELNFDTKKLSAVFRDAVFLTTKTITKNISAQELKNIQLISVLKRILSFNTIVIVQNYRTATRMC